MGQKHLPAGEGRRDTGVKDKGVPSVPSYSALFVHHGVAVCRSLAKTITACGRVADASCLSV
jgi:hypothetical protein